MTRAARTLAISMAPARYRRLPLVEPSSRRFGAGLAVRSLDPLNDESAASLLPKIVHRRR